MASCLYLPSCREPRPSRERGLRGTEKLTRVSSSSILSYSTRTEEFVQVVRKTRPEWRTAKDYAEKEEDFREEATLPGHGGPGRHADPRADRHGTGTNDDGGADCSDGGDRPAAP